MEQAEAAAAAAAAAARARIEADQVRLEAAVAAAYGVKLPFDGFVHSMLSAEPLQNWSRRGPFHGSSAMGEAGDFADVDRAVLLQLLVRERHDLDPYPHLLLMQMSEAKRLAWDDQRVMIAEAHRSALRVFASEASLEVQLELARLLVGFPVAPLGSSTGIGKVAAARALEGAVSLLVEYDEETMSDEMTIDEVLKWAQGYLPGFDTAAPPIGSSAPPCASHGAPPISSGAPPCAPPAAPPAGFGAPPCASPAAPPAGSGAPDLSRADAAPDAAPDAASADAASTTMRGLEQCAKLQRQLVGLVLTAANSTLAAARMKLLAALTQAEIYPRDMNDVCSAQVFIDRLEFLLKDCKLQIGDVFFIRQHFTGKWSIEVNGNAFHILLRGGRDSDGSLSYMSELAEDFARWVEALLASGQLVPVGESIERTTFRMSLTSDKTILRLQSAVNVYPPVVIDEKGIISFEGAADLARADYELADSASVPQIHEIQAIAATLATPKSCQRISTTLTTAARSAEAVEKEGCTSQKAGLGKEGSIRREVASNETFQTLTWRPLENRVPFSQQVVTAQPGVRLWMSNSYEDGEVVGRGDAAAASISASASTSPPASASPAATAATTAIGPSAAADDDDDTVESVRSSGGGDGTAAQAPGVKAAGKPPPMDEEEELAELEKQRLRNVECNQGVLPQLGLASDEPKQPALRMQRPPRPPVPPPSRGSVRLQETPKVDYLMHDNLYNDF